MVAITPLPIKKFFFTVKLKHKHSKIWISITPKLAQRKIGRLQESITDAIRAIDVKDTLHSIEDKKNAFVSSTPLVIKRYLLIFSHLLQKPFSGFTPKQKFALIFCSLASLGAVALIYFQTSRIFVENTKHLRAPASVEALEFDRPEYYKKELKRAQFYGLRIPLYFPEVNQLQTVTIDFSVSFNNRIGRVFIEKKEFPVRDHIIRSLEPVLAKHSLDEEGKIIIKDKIAQEIQEFLDHHQIPSQVDDVTIVYLLAN